MTDPTNRSLEAALLDQKVAGMFHGKQFAYVPIHRDEGKAWGIGIAVANERGYHAVDGGLFQYESRVEADVFCDGMNRHIGLSQQQALMIIASSMRRQVLS